MTPDTALEKAKAILTRAYPPKPGEVLGVIASPLVPPEVAWELVLLEHGTLDYVKAFALNRLDPKGQKFIRARRVWALQHLEEALEKEREPHLASLLWSFSQHLPPEPWEAEAIQEALPRLFRLAEALLPEREASPGYYRARALIERLLPVAEGPEGIPEEAWLRVGPDLDPDVLGKLPYRAPGWLRPVALVAPELVSLPPRGHPDRREVATLSLHAVLEAYPDDMDDEEAAELLPEALKRGHWFDALKRLPQRSPTATRVWSALEKRAENLREIPFLQQTIEAFLPEISPEALASLLIVLPDGSVPSLLPRLKGLYGWPEGRSSFARALLRYTARSASKALKRLEAVGLLDLVMVGEWWRGTVLEDRGRGRVFPLRLEWSPREHLSLLPLPMARELLKKADSAGRAMILRALGERLPRKDWEGYLSSQSQELRAASVLLHARDWYRHLARELEERGCAIPPKEDLLEVAEESYDEYGKPPATLWVGETLVVWSRVNPHYRGRGKGSVLVLSGPWGWLGLRGVDGYGGASRPPSLEEVWHALGLALSLPPEAVRFLLGLGGERAFRALKALAETADNPAEREEVLREALEASEWAHLLRILLAQDLLRI